MSRLNAPLTHKGFAHSWPPIHHLHNSLGANALSEIIQHFSHREHLHNSLPVGATLKVSFDYHAHTHTHSKCPHTHFWTWHKTACTWGMGGNYRHVNDWTLLLWGTADIAGSGQKKRPLTDFNLGLMIVVWACFAAATMADATSSQGAAEEKTLMALDFLFIWKTWRNSGQGYKL